MPLTLPIRRLTVVQIVPDLIGGGVERGTLEIAAELVRRGHRSIVISAGGRLVPELESAGSEHIAWDIGRKHPGTLRHVWSLRKLLKSQSVDLLHVRSRVPAWVAWLAWKSLSASQRPKWVTTVHGFYSVGRFSQIMTSGENVIAVSNSIRDYITTNYPAVSPSRIVVVPRGIDPVTFPRGFVPAPEWYAEWNKKYPETRGRECIALVGRITRLKGHEEFLALIRTLTSTGRNVHGLIVGDEDPRRRGYAAELRSRVVEWGLEDRVTFTGHRSDIREIYAASRIVCSLSSQPESFGRTVLEALAIGVPVLGYHHGGVGEILADLYPQGAVPLGDGQALVQLATAILDQRRALVPPFTSYRLADSLAQEVELYERMA